ncbi:MAG: hypothetical protein H0W73_19300 [Bacteroidetes bacterium]|nr:hypothetical protein [Bacteroidota bacterium]
MENQQQHLEALKDIRQMMKQSNRFLSLSGLTGIFAGVYALVGAYFGHQLINDYIKNYWNSSRDQSPYFDLIFKCIVICTVVLTASLITAFILSARKAKKNGQKLMDHTAWQLLINMLIPLAAGGIFCIAMLFHGGNFIVLVAPAMLIFYGLALVNGSKYTLHDIRYLGCLQILLGIMASFYVGYSLIFWAIGFGVLHIVYGTIMWFKYDRKS